jgi:hypothetical protein
MLVILGIFKKVKVGLIGSNRQIGQTVYQDTREA